MSATAGYKLFTPHTIGKDLQLKNRIVFGPLTRARSDKETREPNEINQLYYEQRTGAGLLITEATAISEQAFGWYGAPALYTDAHVAAWKKVVDRVHAKDGKIFLQLWHMGRQSHSSFNPKNEIVAPSAIGIQQGHLRNSKGEHVPYEVPRALETDEIPGIVEDYRKSAALAKKAGFDGVEIHSGNGYLVDTFLQSSTNTRTDKYGGSFENRARFLLEIIEAIKQDWSSDRIGVRLSPNGGFGSMGSADNFEQFTYTAAQLDKLDLAYVAILDGFGFGYHDKGRLVTAFDIKKVYNGTVIATNSYTRDIAEGAVRSGAADLVSFGRLYISNPDLAERFQNDWPLNPEATYADYWTAEQGAQGYTTFPAYTPKE
jgi:2,4-dienoyl-CoA reductase-like NADH-dependent reductase (Old Yellow Enzyme family)